MWYLQKNIRWIACPLVNKPKPVTSTIGDTRTGTGNSKPLFKFVPEDKGGNELFEDEYSKYDPETSADLFLINSGATIKDSRIEITDSSGRNRALVRRNNNERYKF